MDSVRGRREEAISSEIEIHGAWCLTSWYVGRREEAISSEIEIPDHALKDLKLDARSQGRSYLI